MLVGIYLNICTLCVILYHASPNEQQIIEAMQNIKRHISPAEVESSMRRYYREPELALKHLIEGEGANNGLDLSWKAENDVPFMLTHATPTSTDCPSG